MWQYRGSGAAVDFAMPETPIPFRGQPTFTFRQLDRRAGVPKGTTFRRFKRVRHRLAEGRDFFHLESGRDGELIAALRAAGDAYRAPPDVVLLAAPAWRLLDAEATTELP